MDREQIDGICEKTILGLVLAILVFGPLALGGLGSWEFLVLQGLTVAVMAVCLVRMWVGQGKKILWPPICWAVLAFVVYAVVRYFTADVEYVARKELIRILVYVFLFFAILNNLHSQDSTQVIGFTLIGLGMLLAFYAGFQFMTKTPHVWNLPSLYAGRGSGTYMYPNHLAGFLEMLVPLALAYAMIGRLSHLTKILMGYAAFVMIAGIAVTLSRGGWLATAAALAALCAVLLAQRDYRIQGLVLLALLMGAAIVIVPRVQSLHQRVAKISEENKIDDLRFAIWAPTIHMWRDHFWWGVGPANFDARFPQYRTPQVQMRPGWAHNDYLNTLADYGLIGALIVASAFGLLVWGVFEKWRSVRGGRDDFSRKKSSKFAFLIGASVGLFAILVHSLVDFNLHMPANAILAVTLMALLSSQWRFDTEKYWFRLGNVLRSAASAVIIAGLIYLTAQGVRGAREYKWLHAADKLADTPNPDSYARIAALQKAFAADPQNFETSYAIGEIYRGKSWNGGDDYAAQAKNAMDWYQRGIKLNPYDVHNWLGMGMCLDWIGAHKDATHEEPFYYYMRANELDPNGYFVTANIGWHYVQTEDLAAARTWFERSVRLKWLEKENPMPFEYLPIVERRMKEAAEGQKALQFGPKPVIEPF